MFLDFLGALIVFSLKESACQTHLGCQVCWFCCLHLPFSLRDSILSKLKLAVVLTTDGFSKTKPAVAFILVTMKAGTEMFAFSSICVIAIIKYDLFCYLSLTLRSVSSFLQSYSSCLFFHCW